MRPRLSAHPGAPQTFPGSVPCRCPPTAPDLLPVCADNAPIGCFAGRVLCKSGIGCCMQRQWHQASAVPAAHTDHEHILDQDKVDVLTSYLSLICSSQLCRAC